MLNNINIVEPIFLRNLMIYPITSMQRNSFTVSTVDEVLHSNKGFFHELDTPDVNNIVFENNGDEPVIVLDGEEIIGSLQNRIIASSDFIGAKSSKAIPVICAEEGRWEEIGGFKTGYCSYPYIRSILIKSRHKKIDTQRFIWNEIERKLTITKTASTTSSMHDIYHNLEDEVSRYIEDFQSLNHNTAGFIGIAGNRVLGCDIFITPHIYRKFENKLIRSYVLDAIEYKKKKPDVPDPQKFAAGIQTAFKKIKIRGDTNNIKIKGNGFLGQVLIHNNQVWHVSAFPN